jgi:hypothetical protein
MNIKNIHSLRRYVNNLVTLTSSRPFVRLASWSASPDLKGILSLQQVLFCMVILKLNYYSLTNLAL